MAIKTQTFTGGGGGASTDTLDDVTGRGATTTNAITVGGVSIGTEYSLPTTDGSTNQVLQTNGSGTISFATLDFTGGLEYKGAFNATAGTPSLANAEKGDFYIIDTAGTIYGQTWAVGDHLLINEDMGGIITNSKIDKIDNTQAVTSVNTQTGAVVLSGNDLAADHSASHYTPANSNIDGHLSGIDDEFGTLGTASTQDVGTSASNVVQLDGSARLPAVDGSQLTNLPSTVGGFPLTVVSNPANASANNSYYNTTASGNQAIFTLPAISGLSDGDTFVFNRKNTGELVIRQNDYNAASPTARVEYFGSIAVSHTVTCNQQQFFVRYESGGSKFYIFDKALGTASAQDVGTSASNVVQLDGSARLPAVDGSQLTNVTATSSDTLDDVTGRGATTTNAINVGTITTSGDILADADASRTIGAEATRFITYYGDMNGAIRFKAKNDEGSQINKGQAVYIKGINGTVPTVALADASNSAKMPAFGLAFADANNQAEIHIVSFGNLTDYNTTTYSLSLNDTIYVSATTAGALTNSAPTGESNFIQNIGRVVRADANAGIIKVGGAGRSNATPNLDQDKVFLGNASNQSVSTALSAIGLSKFNNDSNFLTNINNESLNDLSDVSYTAGSGIDNYVLTYDHSTTSWGAEEAASGGYPVQTATSSVTADLNSAVYLTAASATACTVTLPATSGATDGDVVIIVRRSPGSLTIQQNGADSGTLVTYLDQGNASSHTITNNQQQIHVRYDSSGTRWYIYDRAQALVATTGAYSDLSGTPTLATVATTGDYNDLSNLPTLGTAAASATTDFLSATGADTLGGNLDVGTSDIVSSSNNNIEFVADGTGVVKVKPTTSGGHLELDGDGTNVGKLRLMCEQSSHGIYLTGPSHAAAASYTLKFPDTDGNPDEVLKTDGSGNLDWVAQASGGSAPDVVLNTITQNDTISITTSTGIEEVHLINNSTYTASVTIPAASSVGEGYKYNIKRLGAGAVSISPSSGTIDGSSSFSLATQYDSVTLVSDSSNYHII